MAAPSSNWIKTTVNSTDWTGVTPNSTNWIPEDNDPSAGNILLQTGGTLLLQSDNNGALQ